MDTFSVSINTKQILHAVDSNSITKMAYEVSLETCTWRF